MLEEMLCWMSKFSNHYTTAEHGWSRQSSFGAVCNNCYRCAWTVDAVHMKNNYCYSIFIHWTELFIDVIRRQLQLVLYINDYGCIEWVGNELTWVSRLSHNSQKVFGKWGMAGTLEEAVFRLVLYIAKLWGLVSKLTLECVFGTWQLCNLKLCPTPWMLPGPLPLVKGGGAWGQGYIIQSSAKHESD